MSRLMDQYEREAKILRGRSRMTDIQELAEIEGRKWKTIDNELRGGMDGLSSNKADMTALVGYAGLEVTPSPATLPAVTINGTEAALWPTATWSPIAANPLCPKAYRLLAFGSLSTAGTQGTMAFNARFGVLVGSPLIGASVTAAQSSTQTTAQWSLRGDVVILRGGAATTGLVQATFRYSQGTATTLGSAVLPAMEQIFGTAVAGVSVVTDGSVAAGLWVGAIAVTSTTNTFTPHSVIFSSWN